MTISIPLTPEIEAKLRERAASFGKDLVQYAAVLIEQGVTAPTFEEILGPVRHDFAASGMSPDDIDAFGRDLIAKVRRERRAAR
jgi:hypothetical protein